MKKILVAANQCQCGGTEQALFAFLNDIDYAKYQVSLLLTQKTGPWVSRIPEKVQIKTLKFKNPIAYFLLADYEFQGSEISRKVKIRIRNWIQKWAQKKSIRSRYELLERLSHKDCDEYDVALDFYGYGYFLTGYVANCIKASKKAMWIHAELMGWINDIRYCLDRYDKIYCVSTIVKNLFDKEYPAYQEKSTVLLNLLDTERILNLSAQEITDERFFGKFKIVSVGRLVHEKGYDIAIEAASLLKKAGVDFRWYILGTGYAKNQLNRLIHEKNLEENFFLLGFQNNPYSYTKACDLYVQTSRNEGYGLTIQEALLLKKVVVATDIEAFSEQIVDGENGCLVPVNAEAIAEAIQKLIEDRKKISDIEDNLMQTNSICGNYNILYNFIGG